MVQILQPADLSADFSNDGTNAQGGVTIVRSRLVSADAGNALVIGTDGGLRAPAAGASATNLAYTAAAGGGTVTSDTGNDAALPLASTTDAGLAPPRSGAAADYLAGDGTYKTLPGTCGVAAISAAELLALEADPSTGKVTVCIPDGAGTKPVSVPLDDLPGAGGGGGASVDLGAGVLALEFMYGPMLAFRSVFNPGSGSIQQAFNKTGWPVTSVTVPAGATHMALMLQNTNPEGNGMQLETQGEIRLINCVPGDVFAITPTNLLQKNGANVQLVSATSQTVVLPTNKQIVSLNAKPWILQHFTTVDTTNGPAGHQYACVLCPVKVA